MTDTEAGLQARLDETPDDHWVRSILADYLEDIGDERAPGYRALAALGKWPKYFPGQSVRDGLEAWTWWWAMPKGRDYLPRSWWGEIKGYRPLFSGFKNFNTRRGAEDAAALAWAGLSAEVRDDILAGVTKPV
jgi:hypothetical protein